MSDLSQVYDALRKADAAGNTEDAKKLADYIRSQQAAPAEPSTPDRKPVGAAQRVLYAQNPVGNIEALGNMATGAAGAVVGGLAGLGQLATGGSLSDAADTVQGVQGAMTYQPRTDAGLETARLLNQPMQMATQGIGMLGGGLQGAVTPGATFMGGALGDQGDLGQMLGQVGFQGLATVAGKPWETPPSVARPAIPGRDFTPLRDLTAEQSARYAEQRGVGVKPTLGSVTRDPEQVSFEDQAAKTKDGASLRQREVENNAALIRAVDNTDKMRSGRSITENARQAGHTIASALETKANNSMAGVSQLYEQAKASGETKAPVNVKPLRDYLADHNSEMVAVPELKAIAAKLGTMGKRITIDDMENLYKAANQLSKRDDPSAVFMRQVKGKINEITDGVGGDLYRKARQARLDHAMEFEDRQAIADLIGMKSRTDYKTATEDVWRKVVVNGSLEELKDVSRSLLDTNPKRNPAGWQAVREMQGQTIDHLVDQATKNIVLDEKGNRGFSPSGYDKAIKSIGHDKLNYLLGDKAVARLDAILKTSQELKTSPGSVRGSDTALNLKNEAGRVVREEAAKHLASEIPGLRAAVKFFEKRQQAAKHAGMVDEALNPRKASPETIANMAARTKAAYKGQASASRRPYITGNVLPMGAVSGGLQQPGGLQ